jgi:hypothetical protein
MKRLTIQQVNEQKQNFENFLKTANLARIGQKFVTLALINATSTNYPEFTLLRRVLKLANVNADMLHPDTKTIYRDILHDNAIKAYFATRNN